MNLPLLFSITYGPSFDTEYPHVKMSYNNADIISGNNVVTADELSRLSDIYEAEFCSRFDLSQSITFIELLEKLTVNFLQINGDMKVNSKSGSSLNETYLFVEHFGENAAKEILYYAMRTAIYLKRRPDEITQDVKPFFNETYKRIKQLAPSKINLNLLAAAKELSIPYYLIPSTQNVICFGQGISGVFMDSGVSQNDSKIGFGLQFNKISATAIVKALGYPGTNQLAVTDFAQAKRAADILGFPLVVKPCDGSKGNGVSANIRDKNALWSAFSKARDATNGLVIVENFVEGDDYRISVSDGKINGVIRRRAPNVIGDGKTTIKELIENKNSTIEEQALEGNLLQEIVIDSSILDSLSKYSLALDSIPAKGEMINFRSNANVSTGGEVKIIDENDVHDDIKKMVVNIVEAFRLDSVGVDFITSDISCSWQEKGSIIEINSYAMQTPRLAKRLLLNRFSTPESARIKTVLILSNNNNFYQSCSEIGESGLENAGFTTGNHSQLSGMILNLEKRNLAQRCQAFIINPSCTQLLVATDFGEIEKNGLPLDWFEECVIDENSLSNHQFEKSCQDELVTWLKSYVNSIKLI